jgi:hypothetical protein
MPVIAADDRAHRKPRISHEMSSNDAVDFLCPGVRTIELCNGPRDLRDALAVVGRRHPIRTNVLLNFEQFLRR